VIGSKKVFYALAGVELEKVSVICEIQWIVEEDLTYSLSPSWGAQCTLSPSRGTHKTLPLQGVHKELPPLQGEGWGGDGVKLRCAEF
jgi:hypothetical protein